MSNDDRVGEFHRQLATARPWTLVTAGLVAIPCGVLLVLSINSVNPLDLRLAADLAALKPWGASFGPLTANGEGWRLVTAVFMPVNLVQCLINALALWRLGQFLERVIGGFALAVLFVLCGFVGNLAALVWDSGSVTAGMAPAIVGLVAAAVAFQVRCRGTIPRAAARRFRLVLAAFLAFNVGGELLQGCLVLQAYAGAAATGFLAGLLLGRPVTSAADPTRAARTGILAFATIIVALVAPMFTPRVDNLDALYGELARVDDRSQEIYDDARISRDAGRLKDEATANIIEEDILPYWREMSSVFDRLKHPLPRDVERLARIKRYARLRDEAWQTLADGLRQGSADLIDAAATTMAQADEAAKSLEAS
jgi:rhomboid protease GluP